MYTVAARLERERGIMDPSFIRMHRGPVEPKRAGRAAGERGANVRVYSCLFLLLPFLFGSLVFFFSFFLRRDARRDDKARTEGHLSVKKKKKKRKPEEENPCGRPFVMFRCACAFSGPFVE